jgi:type VI protein secretion system component Hcp
MGTVSHHRHGGTRALIGLGVAVAGLTVGLGLALTGPSVADAATAAAASNQYQVYLVLPGTTAGKVTGEAKSTPSTAVREELSAFSLYTTAAAPGAADKAATPAASSASATMAINMASVQLLRSVAAASKMSADVDFYDTATGALALSYKFTDAVFTSYLLQDGPSGSSVQVTFAYQQVEVDYITVTPNSPASPPVTYIIKKAPGS